MRGQAAMTDLTVNCTVLKYDPLRPDVAMEYPISDTSRGPGRAVGPAVRGLALRCGVIAMRRGRGERISQRHRSHRSPVDSTSGAQNPLARLKRCV